MQVYVTLQLLNKQREQKGNKQTMISSNFSVQTCPLKCLEAAEFSLCAVCYHQCAEDMHSTKEP